MLDKARKDIKPIRKSGRTTIEKVLQELKKELQAVYGERLQRLILYGSYARSQGYEGSDIDVAVLLDDMISPGREIDRMVDLITDINLKYNVLISVYPVSATTLQKIRSPLLLNIRKEGITI
jgi:predicted nucleotidyltransferase